MSLGARSMKTSASRWSQGVIAERHRVGADVDKFVEDCLGDAEAAGGVLTIEQDEIERPVADQAGQLLADNRAPGPADHIADE